MPFYLVKDGGQAVGFLASKLHSSFTVTAENLCMGVLTEVQRQGVGRQLFR